MPITADEFDSGGQEAAIVLDFLRARADNAYTFGELAQDLGGTDVTLDDLDYALHMLVSSEVVERNFRVQRVYCRYRPHEG